jgi:hypothetical protein
MPHRHSNQELQRVAEAHVGYELRQMASMVGARGVGPGSGLATTALVEASLVHIRNLHEFLAKGMSTDDDTTVVAAHYLGTKPATCSPLTHNDLVSIHQKVAHLTCNRESLRRAHMVPKHVRVRWAREMIAAFDAFEYELRSSKFPHRAAWFQRPIADAKRELALSASNAYSFRRA